MSPVSADLNIGSRGLESLHAACYAEAEPLAMSDDDMGAPRDAQTGSILAETAEAVRGTLVARLGALVLERAVLGLFFTGVNGGMGGSSTEAIQSTAAIACTVGSDRPRR
jgi:hypothetical protein